MLQSYKDLIVWKKSFQLTVIVYSVSKRFPKSELYGITSQIRRAAFAIPSNIAEGYTRKYRAEYLQFLRIAFSSGAELETQLLICKEIGILEEKDYKELENLLSEIMKMLNSLIKSLGIKG